MRIIFARVPALKGEAPGSNPEFFSTKDSPCRGIVDRLFSSIHLVGLGFHPWGRLHPEACGAIFTASRAGRDLSLPIGLRWSAGVGCPLHSRKKPPDTSRLDIHSRRDCWGLFHSPGDVLLRIQHRNHFRRFMSCRRKTLRRASSRRAHRRPSGSDSRCFNARRKARYVVSENAITSVAIRLRIATGTEGSFCSVSGLSSEFV